MKAIQALIMLLLSISAACVTGLEVQTNQVASAGSAVTLDEELVVESRRSLQKLKCKGGSNYSKKKKACTCAGVGYYDKKQKKCLCPSGYKKIFKGGKAKCINLTSKSPKA